MATNAAHRILESDPGVWEITTAGAGPQGSLPLTAEMLLERPSGDIFGLTQNAGMGWSPAEAGREQFLILSTQGGLRAPDGRPIALGYHTGHWEIGLQVQAADKLTLLRLGDGFRITPTSALFADLKALLGPAALS